MADWNPRTNGTLRGFIIIVAVAAAITASGQAGAVGLALVLWLLRIGFLAAITYVLIRLWRRNREQFGMWPRRARLAFFGAAVVGYVALIAAFLWPGWPAGPLESIVFFFVLAACGFSMWRVWQDEHTYGY